MNTWDEMICQIITTGRHKTCSTSGKLKKGEINHSNQTWKNKTVCNIREKVCMKINEFKLHVERE